MGLECGRSVKVRLLIETLPLLHRCTAPAGAHSLGTTLERSMKDAEVTEDRNAYRFRTEVRVRLSETDAVGIVFFGSFSTYMDVGRMDYLNHLSLAWQDGQVKDLAPGAVVAATERFHSPARYNDVLEVHVRMARIGRTSYTFHYLMTDKRQPRVVATGKVTLVWLDGAFKPLPIPEEFRSAVADFEGNLCLLEGD